MIETAKTSNVRENDTNGKNRNDDQQGNEGIREQ